MPRPDAGAATVRTIVQAATAELATAGIDGPGNDARRLVAAALGLSGAELLSQPERRLSGPEAEQLRGWIARRAAREPVSRILGTREFYGRAFTVGPATLDPRPDSETLIDATLEMLRERGRLAEPLCILDVGTGTGCLLLTLLCELPHATGTGTDISQPALDIAAANAGSLGVAARCGWLAADALEGVAERFDLLISNPPYIASAEIDQLAPEVRDFDPRAALDGGADGLDFYRRLAATAGNVVNNGLIVLEVGRDQADAVCAMLRERFPPGLWEVRTFQDMSGVRRCVAVGARN